MLFVRKQVLSDLRLECVAGGGAAGSFHHSASPWCRPKFRCTCYLLSWLPTNRLLAKVVLKETVFCPLKADNEESFLLFHTLCVSAKPSVIYIKMDRVVVMNKTGNTARRCVREWLPPEGGEGRGIRLKVKVAAQVNIPAWQGEELRGAVPAGKKAAGRPIPRVLPHPAAPPACCTQ